MQPFLKEMKRAFRRFGKRIRRLWQRACRALGRLSLQNKLIAGGSAALCVLLVITGVVLLTRNRSASAEGQDISDQPMNLSATVGEDGSIDIAPETTPAPTWTPAPTPTPTPDPTLRRGMECDEVLELQERLMELGYMEQDEPTRKFGPATEAAVTLFQRQVNFTETLDMTLQQDGIAGIQTLGLIYSDDAPKYCVMLGMEGDDIYEVQQQLKDLGYMSAITGYYGETTTKAIKDFQDRNGLSADGLAGPKTMDLLYSPDARESASKAHQARTRANIDKMISTAKAQLGKKYVLGNRGPNSFDCSGLVYYCLKQAGSNRNRLTAAGYSQVSEWEKITRMSDLKKGDLICFYSNDFSKIGHVGIVINNSGEMIDASNNLGKVVRRPYDTSYWRKHFYCGRRPW